jgi:hypothetical protein
MSRPRQRLFDLEIDEVSAVDRPANQHGLISFAKAADDTSEEGGMSTLYAENGAPVSEDDLEHGATYRDDEGNEYVFVADGYEEGDDENDGEPAGDEPESEVGKAGPGQLERGLKSALGGWKEPGLNRAGRAANWVGKNPKKAGAAAAGAAGVAGGGAYMLGEANKSFGDTVLEQLSKAVTESDRDQIIAKAMNEVEVYKAQADAMGEALEQERDIRITEAFIAKAADYNLPIAPARLGPILKSIAEVLDDEDLEVLDELLSSVGNALYEELGYSGGASNSGVLDEVYGLGAELVGKSAGNISLEQATTAMFETNPGAYEAYLAENGR